MRDAEEAMIGDLLEGPWIPARPVPVQLVTPDPEPVGEPEVLIPDEILPPTPTSPRVPARGGSMVDEPLRLPVWMTDRAVARARADYGRRIASRYVVRGGRRLPLAVGRGLWRGGVRWHRWVRAEDLAWELRDTDSGRLGRDVFTIRDHRKVRWIITGSTLGGVGLTELVADLVVGGWVPVVSALAAGAVAAVGGRRRREPGELPFFGVEKDVRVGLDAGELDNAFRAAGLLKPGMSLVQIGLIGRDGKGWLATIDLPRGGGKTAADAIRKSDVIAGELGCDEIQLDMKRVRAAAGGHGMRLSLWLADDDPYLGDPIPSALIDTERFDFWGPIPLGRDARGRAVDIQLLWQSAFFGGLPRRGKTFTMRLLVAAGVLDPWVSIYLADGKGGGDFKPVAGVAVRYIRGADDADLDAFEGMLDELIAEMTRRFIVIGNIPASMCPEGKLTPEIMRKYGLPLILAVIDELQEYFEALESEKDRARIVGKLARIARRGPAAGIMPIYASQRPDAKSVPTKLREIVSYRYCTQVIDATSSDMVLGDGRSKAGANAAQLSEEHVGVGVLVTGPGSFVTVKADYLDNRAFEEVCRRGRALRLAEGTLSGQAAGDLGSLAGEGGFTIPPIIVDVLEAFGQRQRIWTADLLAALVNIDEDAYGEWDSTTLAAELERAGVTRSTKQVKIDGENRAGYVRRDVEGAIPAEILARRPVEGVPSTTHSNRGADSAETS